MINKKSQLVCSIHVYKYSTVQKNESKVLKVLTAIVQFIAIKFLDIFFMNVVVPFKTKMVSCFSPN